MRRRWEEVLEERQKFVRLLERRRGDKEMVSSIHEDAMDVDRKVSKNSRFCLSL